MALMFSGCDTVQRVSVSRPIPAGLDRTCVIEVLRMEEVVREVGVGAAGNVYAELIIPQNLGYGGEFTVGVEERKNDDGELELIFENNWVGPSLRPEYRAYLEKTLTDLRDRTIERCGSK